MPGLDVTPDTWINVFLIVTALVIASVASLRLSVRDWTLPLMPLLATTAFADVSRFLPAGMFSDGLAGKDQIIFASAFCTLFGAIILATMIVGAVSALIRALRSS